MCRNSSFETVAEQEDEVLVHFMKDELRRADAQDLATDLGRSEGIEGGNFHQYNETRDLESLNLSLQTPPNLSYQSSSMQFGQLLLIALYSN